MDEVSARAAAAAHVLREAMRGDALLPADEGYEQARQVWNAAVAHRPALIARCETAADVQAALLAARSQDLPVSVRGGGHDWAGRALRHDGIVLDLTRMRDVEVDEATWVATVAGGALADDLIEAAAAHGLGAATGISGTVGMAGLSLAGGYSPLSSRYGLAVDNLLGVDLVLADGRLVTADDNQNTNLYWAVRGGGGNFGVVTSMRIQLHPIETVVSGPIIFPWSQAASVLRAQAELLATVPDDLGLVAALIPGAQGEPAVIVTPTWFGDAEEGERVLARCHELGTPTSSRVTTMPYRDLTKAYDAALARGRHYEVRTRSMREMTGNVIAALVSAMDGRSSPFSTISWQYLHGAAARVRTPATAFGFRCRHYQLQIQSAWTPEDPAEPHRAWAADVSTALAPYSLPGGYPNLLTDEDQNQIPYAYGENLPRLARLKRQFDPDDVFSSATPLPH